MKNSPKKEEWKQACQEAGLRPSKTRGLVLLLLQGSKKPLSVPEIMNNFFLWSYQPNKTTLYREIEKLLAVGQIQKVQLSESRVSYELSGSHHHHFVCQGCQSVTPVSVSETPLKKTETTLSAAGNIVWYHSLEFFGICKKCYQ